MTITTNRLVLRPLALSDAESLWPFVSDPAISRFMSWKPHSSIDETRAFIADVEKRMAEGTTFSWIVSERSGGHVCGLISLLAILRVHRALRYDKAELAYWIGPAYQGRGYATEMCTAVIDHAFTGLGLHKLCVAHDKENAASEALIARLGFRMIGVEEKHFEKEGRWIDHVIYEMLAPHHKQKPFA